MCGDYTGKLWLEEIRSIICETGKFKLFYVVCILFFKYIFYLKFQYTDGKRKEFQSTIDRNLRTFIVLPILLHPKSNGSIRLQSDDPFDPPLIDPNYLDHPDDVKTLLRGITIYQFRFRISINTFVVILFFLIIRILKKHEYGKSQTSNYMQPNILLYMIFIHF